MFLARNITSRLTGIAAKAAEGLKDETRATKDAKSSEHSSSGSDTSTSAESEDSEGVEVDLLGKTEEVAETVETEEPALVSNARGWLMGQFFQAKEPKKQEPDQNTSEVETDVNKEEENETAEVVEETEEKMEAEEAVEVEETLKSVEAVEVEETVEATDGNEKANVTADTPNWFKDNFCCFLKGEEGTKAGAVELLNE